MRFPLTEQLLREAAAFELRAACRDCFFWNAAKGECWHGWPDDGQRDWPRSKRTEADAEAANRAAAGAPADAAAGASGEALADGGEAGVVGGEAAAGEARSSELLELGREVSFCKEFELR